MNSNMRLNVINEISNSHSGVKRVQAARETCEGNQAVKQTPDVEKLRQQNRQHFEISTFF